MSIILKIFQRDLVPLILILLRGNIYFFASVLSEYRDSINSYSITRSIPFDTASKVHMVYLLHEMYIFPEGLVSLISIVVDGVARYITCRNNF